MVVIDVILNHERRLKENPCWPKSGLTFHVRIDSEQFID